MFRIKARAAAIVFFLIHSPLWGSLSSGGDFALDMSFDRGSGSVGAAGGDYLLSGSAGPGFCPIGVLPHFPLRGYPVRLYEGFYGSPLWTDPSAALTIQIPNTNNRIAIPAHTLPLPYDPMLVLNPMIFPIQNDPTALQNAVGKLKSQYGDFVDAPVAAVELSFLLNDHSLFSDAVPLSIVFSLPPPPDNPAPDETARRTLPTMFNSMIQNWEFVSADFSPDALSFTATGFFPGVFAVFQTGSLIAGGAKAYPVPWRPNAGQPVLYGTPDGGITFANLPSVGVITIFNVAGEVVREIIIPPGLASGVLVWDGRTGAGRDVASGVYHWIVRSTVDSKTGKLMIIR